MQTNVGLSGDFVLENLPAVLTINQILSFMSLFHMISICSSREKLIGANFTNKLPFAVLFVNLQ
jgi:hypothetical protein